MKLFNSLGLWATTMSLALHPAFATAQPSQSPPTAAATMDGIQHGSVVANGVRLHYVTAGTGEPVLLIPGWPESWYAWRSVIPELVKSGRRVYAIDPRGFGDSEKPATGYELETSAKDIHAFIGALGLAKEGGIDVVSHDVGTWIAYTHALTYPNDVRRLVLSEALIPGVPPPAGIPSDAANLKTWHFGFNRLRDLPELLVQGHERAYLSWLFANKSVRGEVFEPAVLDEYVRIFSAPGAARAGFEYYRVNFDDAALARAKARSGTALAMPILTIGAEGSVGEALHKTVMPLNPNTQGVVLAGCGHFVMEECPADFSGAVISFWAATR